MNLHGKTIKLCTKLNAASSNMLSTSSQFHPMHLRWKDFLLHVQEWHTLPLRYARPKRLCSTSPMWATTISRTSLHTALMSQLSSSFWLFSSTTTTFLCTSSTLPRFLWAERGGKTDEVINETSSFFYTHTEYVYSQYIYILTIIEEGTDKATQGSLAIFTNSGPWKICHWGIDTKKLSERERAFIILFFSPKTSVPVGWLVRFVGRITQKLMNRFSWDLNGGWDRLD